MTRDEFEQAKFIVEGHRAIHTGRKKREYQIVITTLTFYVLCIASRNSFNATFLNLHVFRITAIASFLVLAVAAWIDIHYSAKANKVDQEEIAEKAEDLILKSLDLTPPAKHPRKLAWLWQAALIALGALLASIAMGTP